MRGAFVLVLLAAAGQAEAATICGQTVKADVTELTCTKPVAAGDDLEKLAKLRTLHLECTSIDDFGVLAKLPALVELTTLAVKAKDATTLAKLPKLEALSADYDLLADLEVVKSLPHLERLEVLGAKVHDLAPLTSLAELEDLALRGTTATDVSPLGQLTHVKKLVLGDARISDVKALAAMTSLEDLEIRGPATIDLAPLAKLPLTRLLVTSDVADLGPLASMTRLRQVDVAYTGKNYRPLYKLPNLKEIWLPSGVPTAQVRALKKAHPGLVVHIPDGAAAVGVLSSVCHDAGNLGGP